MSSEARGTAAFLLVSTGERRVGIPVEYLVAVAEVGETHPVPSPEPALRGVAQLRGRTMPVVHLGALLAGAACPPEAASTGVIVRLGATQLCLEVDAADVVVREPVLALASGAGMAWARGVVRRPDGLVPLLDFGALAARLTEIGVAT